MAQCECLEGCPFFHEKMDDMPNITRIYKNRYCLGSNFDCARHMVFRELGSEHVPENMYPNQVDRAAEILNGVTSTPV
jgi:hypothetical protein